MPDCLRRTRGRCRAATTLAALTLALSAPLSLQAQTSAAPAASTPTVLPAPPQALREPKDVTVHGDTRIDDYFWLRNRQDPRVLAHLQAEKAHADAWFAPLRPLQQRLYQEMLGRVQQSDETVPWRQGRWWYATRTVEGQAYPLHVRRPAVGADRHWDAQAPEQVLFDLNALGAGKKYLALGDQRVSPDGRLVAYTTDETGGRDFVLQVRRVGDGRGPVSDLDFRMPEVSSFAWAADSRTLFYVTMDSAKRSDRLWRVVPGSGEPAVLVHQEPDAQFDIEVDRTRDGRWLVLGTASKDESDVRVLDARTPRGAWRVLLPRRAGVMVEVDHGGGRFYVRSNDTGPDFRLYALDARHPDAAHATELIAAQPGRMLQRVDVFRHHLVTTERRQGQQALVIRDLRRRGPAAEHVVAFDEAAYTVRLRQNAEFDTDSLRFSYQSLATPETVYDYRMDSRVRTLRKRQPVLGGFDPTHYATARLLATAPDGTAVPVSLVWRQDLRRPGTPQPLLLYGYGSYGLPSDPTFSPSRLSLLDRGVVVAIAHIRGGGDLGRSWYEAGKMAHKQHSFDDFIACAQMLVDSGWTRPQQLAIEGGSAGGLLMGAVVNQRPALFKAVVASVPFVDVINTMLDESLPLTTAEFLEWGNPKIEAQYRWMRAYSPYDNLKPGAYPAMLLRTGLNDSQVPYWEPAKYVARLRTLKTDANPLLLTVNLDAGHGGASGRYDALKERAEITAFLLTQWGLQDAPAAR